MGLTLIEAAKYENRLEHLATAPAASTGACPAGLSLSAVQGSAPGHARFHSNPFLTALSHRPPDCAFTIKTHDSWGIVKVGTFQSLEEARKVFSSLCEDPWYKSDGMVKGVELLQDTQQGEGIRMDWYTFR